MKFAFKNIWLFVALAAILGPAVAVANTVGHGEGGHVRDFAAIVGEYNMSGKQFRIDGACRSACTMFLGIRNVCLTRGARLYFHSGHNREETGGRKVLNPQATATMQREYNWALLSYIREKRYMDTVEFHMIPGSMLIDRFGYAECGKH